jgi:cyclopropane fatty-acyl-phospholipid synthase-like methyltransferase
MSSTITGHGPTSSQLPGHDDVIAVWDEHPDEDYRRDMSHWRGHGRWADETWTAIGAATVTAIHRAAKALGREIPTGPLLEWGPGGGANLAAFAGISQRLYGADISMKNLAECARMLAEFDPPPEFRPILVGEDPNTVTDAIDEPIDVFVSTAVFQHFPTREYGSEVLRAVTNVLTPGALGCVQIRYDDGTPKYLQKQDDYFGRHVAFTSYPLDEFWDMINSVGLEPLDISALNSSVNYATFSFVAP